VTCNELNEVVKKYYADGLGLEWGQNKAVKCDNLLRPLVPYFDKDSGNA